MQKYITILEMIGTIAFAMSGATKGVEFDLDLFGVIIMGVTTATGGGIFRDLILGKNPPSAFTNPQYVTAAAITSLVVFSILYINRDSIHPGKKAKLYYDTILLFADSLGLGIFTAMGVMAAWNMYRYVGTFLFVFCGVITGVGGGLLRDMMLSDMPAIFTKYVYASACIVGALIEVKLFRMGYFLIGIWAATFTVLVIRMFAATGKWSLPKIPKKE